MGSSRDGAQAGLTRTGMPWVALAIRSDAPSDITRIVTEKGTAALISGEQGTTG